MRSAFALRGNKTRVGMAPDVDLVISDYASFTIETHRLHVHTRRTLRETRLTIIIQILSCVS